MNRPVVLAVLALVAFTAFCDAAKPVRKSYKDMTPAELAQLKNARLRQNGGFVILKGKGSLAVLNAKTPFSEGDIAASLDQLKGVVRGLKIDFKSVEKFSLATAKAERENAGAGACVYLVDDPALPMSLVALEEGWGVVNVAALNADNPPAEKLKARFQKEFVRVSSIVFSGVKSQYLTSPLQSVTSLAELDKTIGDAYGMDTIMAIANHLPEIGVVCDSRITYREACQRGIAESPTNEYQKAIWDQVHALPEKPIKIEFDAKRDAGK